jgi:16S rRNA (guanine527-N7)-methyltransferase
MNNGESREKIELAVFSLIERGLVELGMHAESERVSKLTRLVMLVSEWATRISLTGHRDPLEMASNLVLDAAALSTALPEISSASRLADLGSGVGFPGLPIAILHPDLEVLLVESRMKRHHLQREVRRKLELPRAVPVLGRVEEVEPSPSDIVVAQAMTQPEQALQLMKPWVRPGGLVALPASSEAKTIVWPTGFEEFSLRTYRVPTTGRTRSLWVARTLASRRA